MLNIDSSCTIVVVAAEAVEVPFEGLPTMKAVVSLASYKDPPMFVYEEMANVPPCVMCDYF